ncbi:hypothetical protein AVEN_162336-1 [Araneus ventricosus]|uniref:Uncharacterized protein n=1 Tax=Araneus ventricosus TaxID=182803 RepID=A0A4Y2X175_ARAVE|nr:hypothetical protein AVEN_162336-1 [Araneus ventricosus]
MCLYDSRLESSERLKERYLGTNLIISNCGQMTLDVPSSNLCFISARGLSTYLSRHGRIYTYIHNPRRPTQPKGLESARIDGEESHQPRKNQQEWSPLNFLVYFSKKVLLPLPRVDKKIRTYCNPGSNDYQKIFR